MSNYAGSGVNWHCFQNLIADIVAEVRDLTNTHLPDSTVEIVDSDYRFNLVRPTRDVLSGLNLLRYDLLKLELFEYVPGGVHVNR